MLVDLTHRFLKRETERHVRGLQDPRRAFGVQAMAQLLGADHERAGIHEQGGVVVFDQTIGERVEPSIEGVSVGAVGSA